MTVTAEERTQEQEAIRVGKEDAGDMKEMDAAGTRLGTLCADMFKAKKRWATKRTPEVLRWSQDMSAEATSLVADIPKEQKSSDVDLANAHRKMVDYLVAARKEMEQDVFGDN